MEWILKIKNYLGKDLITMFSVKELLLLWANDDKRREFIKDYKIWGLWFAQPELGLTFYKYDLPGGDRIIAMEYLREPGYYERQEGSEFVIGNRFYLQRGKYFTPSSVFEGTIANHLKDIKVKLTAEQKQRDRQCRRCGSKSFQHKADGSVLCTACMYLIQAATEIQEAAA